MASSITLDVGIDRGIYPNLSRCQYQVKPSEKQRRSPRFQAAPRAPLPTAEHLGKEAAVQLICWPSTLPLPDWPPPAQRFTSQIKRDGWSIKASICSLTDRRLSRRCCSVVKVYQKQQKKRKTGPGSPLVISSVENQMCGPHVGTSLYMHARKKKLVQVTSLI